MGGDRGRRVRWLEQVHGSRVLVAGVPRADPEFRVAGAPAPQGRPPASPDPVACAGPGDGLVAAAPDLALAVLTADCASIALGSPEGVFGAVHAGWRGLVAGVVDRAVRTMVALGATGVVGALGPCIHAECYEFSEDDLAQVTAVCGEAARATTAEGRPALDLPAAVNGALVASGARLVPGPSVCTACGPGYFSHRARRDRARQALVVWCREGPPG